MKTNTKLFKTSKRPVPTKERETEMFDALRKLDPESKEYVELRNLIIEPHLKLASAVAAKFSHRHLSQTDMAQTGVFGLMRAADMFNPGINVRFSSYAYHICRQFIFRGIAKTGATIRIPDERYWQKKHRERGVDFGAKANDIIDNLPYVPTSLDSPVSSYVDDGELIIDTLSGSEETPESELIAADLTSLLKKAVASLPPPDRQVITLRFGLAGKEPASAKDVAKTLGITVATVRGIEQRAIRELRPRLK